METVKMIFCADKNNCALIAKQTPQNKWKLWGYSGTLETGEPKYGFNVFHGNEFDAVEPINSTTGRTTIKVLENGDWREIVFIQYPKVIGENTQMWQWAPGKTPMLLEYATFDENEGETLESLLERGAGIKTILIDLTNAAAYSNCKKDADSINNKKNAEYLTPIIEYFLKNGIDPNEKDEWENTALKNARKGNMTKIVALLVEYGAE